MPYIMMLPTAMNCVIHLLSCCPLDSMHNKASGVLSVWTIMCMHSLWHILWCNLIYTEDIQHHPVACL
jgi:hypothetical protein